MGSVRGLIGGKFNREDDREFYNYDVYGASSETSAAGNPFLFAGYRFDTESGTYHLDKRIYAPETGRFLQLDPIGYVDSMNLYEYCKSSPLHYKDPFGLMSVASCVETIQDLINNSAKIKSLYNKAIIAKDGKGKRCLTYIKCVRSDKYFIPGASWSPKYRSITIPTIPDGLEGLFSLEQDFAHELIHAINCGDGTNCEERMQNEMSAYYHSRDDIKDEEDLIKKAWGSCSGSKACKGKSWEDYKGKFQYPPSIPMPKNPGEPSIPPVHAMPD